MRDVALIGAEIVHECDVGDGEFVLWKPERNEWQDMQGRCVWFCPMCGRAMPSKKDMRATLNLDGEL